MKEISKNKTKQKQKTLFLKYSGGKTTVYIAYMIYCLSPTLRYHLCVKYVLR